MIEARGLVKRFGVMCLFVAIVYAIAWILLDRRDA